MSLLGGKPESGSKTLANSSKIAYQRDKSAVGADMEFKLDYGMPSYCLKASFGIHVQ